MKVHKTYINKTCTKTMKNLFQLSTRLQSCKKKPYLVHSFNLRRVLPHSLFIPFCRTSTRKKYFTFRLLPIWNILPSTVLNTNVTKCFMHKIQNIDLSNFYKSP